MANKGPISKPESIAKNRSEARRQPIEIAGIAVLVGLSILLFPAEMNFLAVGGSFMLAYCYIRLVILCRTVLRHADINGSFNGMVRFFYEAYVDPSADGKGGQIWWKLAFWAVWVVVALGVFCLGIAIWRATYIRFPSSGA